jgi:hypothetical protein
METEWIFELLCGIKFYDFLTRRSPNPKGYISAVLNTLKNPPNPSLAKGGVEKVKYSPPALCREGSGYKYRNRKGSPSLLTEESEGGGDLWDSFTPSGGEGGFKFFVNREKISSTRGKGEPDETHDRICRTWNHGEMDGHQPR